MSEGKGLKARGLLGLALRAGALVPGAEMSLKLIREGKAALAILDREASPNTSKKIRDACNHRGIQVMLMDAGLLGQAAGKPGMAAAAMKTGSFAREFTRLCAETIQDSSTK